MGMLLGDREPEGSDRYYTGLARWDTNVPSDATVVYDNGDSITYTTQDSVVMGQRSQKVAVMLPLAAPIDYSLKVGSKFSSKQVKTLEGLNLTTHNEIKRALRAGIPCMIKYDQVWETYFLYSGWYVYATNQNGGRRHEWFTSLAMAEAFGEMCATHGYTNCTIYGVDGTVTKGEI